MPARPGGFEAGGGDLALALGWRVFAQRPEVAATYSLQRLVGKGSYGHVVEAIHTPTGNRVAIKRIQFVFDDERDARCILREIRILRLVRHDNIVKLLDVIAPHPREWATFNDVYIVFEYIPTDLEKVVNSNQYFSAEHVRGGRARCRARAVARRVIACAWCAR